MKKIYIINIVMIALFIIFFKIMSVEFTKIENKVVDKYDEKVITTYTTRDDIEKFYINNQKFLSELTYELNGIDEIYKYTQISIPFNYPKEDVIFYGNKNNNVEISESLSKKFVLLSNGLKINKIIIRRIYDEESSNGNLKCSFIFLQSDLTSNTFISLMGSPTNLNYNTNFFTKIAFSVKNNATASRAIKIDEYDGIYWYYYISRDLDKKRYPFWNRVYDIVKGNLK